MTSAKSRKFLKNLKNFLNDETMKLEEDYFLFFCNYYIKDL